MKITRHRKIKHGLKFYKINYNFRAPFQVLIDGTFCHAALEDKINLKEQIPKYLEDPNVRLFTTACIIKEMEMLGSRVYGSLHIAKQFVVRKCGHEMDALSGTDCLLSLLGEVNPHHFFIATTDPDLSEKCRGIAGVPILYLKYKAVILEKPFQIKQTVVQDEVKGEIFKKKSSEEEKPKKRKGPKQPNPLSCLKKKTVVTKREGVAKVGRKRNRKKNRGMVATGE